MIAKASKQMFDRPLVHREETALRAEGEVEEAVEDQVV